MMKYETDETSVQGIATAAQEEDDPPELVAAAEKLAQLQLDKDTEDDEQEPEGDCCLCQRSLAQIFVSPDCSWTQSAAAMRAIAVKVPAASQLMNK